MHTASTSSQVVRTPSFNARPPSFDARTPVVDAKAPSFDAAYKWYASLLLFPICAYCCINQGGPTLLDSTSLLMHELGYFASSQVGTFASFFGGTFVQLLIPFSVLFFFNHFMFCIGTQVAFVWLGQNMINLSAYATSSPASENLWLGSTMYDWFDALNALGMTQYDDMVGGSFYILGILCFFAALLMPLQDSDLAKQHG